MLSTGTRVAVSVAPRGAEEIPALYSEALSAGADLVELRLDALASPDPGAVVGALGGLACDRLILTYRSREEGGFGGPLDSRSVELLARASDACPGSLLDAELSGIRRLVPLRDLAASRGGSVIVSRHYASPPSEEEAASDYREMLDFGRYAKLVFPASRHADNALPIRLYGRLGRERLISFCVGAKGVMSRLLSALLGAPIAYASLPGRPVAEGQLPPDEFAQLVEALASVLGPRNGYLDRRALSRP